MKNLILFLTLVLVGGCGHTIPEYWTTYEEAYPTSSIEDCNSLSSGSCRRATFNYSFEDVYSAAIIALTNSQINVQDENKSSGDIFAG